jgi:hypothetical protein
MELPMRFAWTLLLAAAFLLAACGGDNHGDPTSTPAPAATATQTASTPTAPRASTATATASRTPTQTAEACPIAAEACSFAAQIAQNVLEGDGDAVISSAQSTLFECPGPNGGLGDPFPLCDGAATGEMRAGFPMRQIQSSAGAISETDAVRLVSEWSGRAEPSLSDDYGGGAAQAYTIACPDVAPNEGQECDERFSLVFSGLAPGSGGAQGALRTMLVVDVQRTEGDYRVTGFATGVLTFGLDLALRGGTGAPTDPGVPSVLAPPGDWTSVTFFPWEPLQLPQ